MAPYFETVTSFAAVETPNVPTQKFLEASDGLIKMFDLIGGAVFGFVQTDLKSNIAGVRRYFESTKETSPTLELLAESDQSSGGSKEATACLVRLLRGLSLTYNALQQLQEDPNAELHVCFRRSYDRVLRHHHSFVIRSAVAVAIRAVPWRDDFYRRIAQGGPVEDLDAAMKKWLIGLQDVVDHMSAWLREKSYGNV
ncbi:glycolipid transfer protein [Pterulicium gracile]|uniref:Glycolipid transfer protein n=1 Tax=Pterulicium gracile TaxID=1884261 RepID=A0A5C3R3E8_9AGAR|nr:glycolipid transfer protein [Pterula gracilis]